MSWQTVRRQGVTQPDRLRKAAVIRPRPFFFIGANGGISRLSSFGFFGHPGVDPYAAMSPGTPGRFQ